MVSQPDARPPVVLVRRRLAAIVAGGEVHRADQLRPIKERIGRYLPRERRSLIQLEKGEAVVTLGARHVEFVTQAKNHRQLRRQLPIVPEIPSPIRAGGSGRRIVTHRTARRNAQQHRGEAEAVGSARIIRVELRPAGVEAVLTRRLAQLQEVDHQLAIVHSPFEYVARGGLRGARIELVIHRDDDQVSEGRLPERRYAVDVNAREFERLQSRRVFHISRKTQLRYVEAGRKRQTIRARAPESIPHVEQQSRIERICLVVRETVYAANARPIADGSAGVPEAVEGNAIAGGSREARGYPPIVVDRGINTQAEPLVVVYSLARRDEVVDLCVEVGRSLVRLRPVFHQVARDRADAGVRNSVVRERIADELRVRGARRFARIETRVGARGERIVDDDRLTVGGLQAREIAAPPFIYRNGSRAHRR